MAQSQQHCCSCRRSTRGWRTTIPNSSSRGSDTPQARTCSRQIHAGRRCTHKINPRVRQVNRGPISQNKWYYPISLRKLEYLYGGAWWHISLISAFQMQRQIDLYELQVSLIYKDRPYLKQTNNKRKEKKNKHFQIHKAIQHLKDFNITDTKTIQNEKNKRNHRIIFLISTIQRLNTFPTKIETR